MNLQPERMGGSSRWPIPKLMVVICFGLACGMLIGTLLSTSFAATGAEPQMHATGVVRNP